MTNLSVVQILIGVVWFFIGLVAGYFFMVILEMSTRKLGEPDGKSVLIRMALGWVLRIGGMGLLIFMAVRMNAIYAVIFVIGFSIMNYVQVGMMRRRAEVMDQAMTEQRKKTESGETNGRNT